MVDRISTFSQHRKTVDDVLRVQGNLARIQGQISSGRKASTFGELGSDIRQVLDLESSIKSTGRFVQSNQVVISRLKTMDTSISQLQSLASDLSQQLALERSAVGADLDLTEFAKTTLARVSDSLNAQNAGRFLFAGSKTDLPPIAAGALNTSNIVNEAPSASYYQGDSLKFSTKASLELDVEYGITANDEAFQDLIGALNFAIRSESSTGFGDDDLQSAIALVESSLDKLGRLSSQVNTDIITLTSVNDQHKRAEINLKESLSDTIGTDVVEASIQAALNEAVLTATLQTFTSLSRLTLSEFLR